MFMAYSLAAWAWEMPHRGPLIPRDIRAECRNGCSRETNEGELEVGLTVAVEKCRDM